MKSSRVYSAIILLFLVFTVNNAFAHQSGKIEAEAVCDERTGYALLNYETRSWALDPRGANPEMHILINNVVVDSGAFEAPDYSFSGSVPLPFVAAGEIVTVTVYAAGDWGNGVHGGQSESTTVTIPSLDCIPDEALGRFTGGGNLRVNGLRITRGLTIHCDLLLSNNLQINWRKRGRTKRFHLTEHLTTVACTDDPEIIQHPPNAPLDTLVGTGIGRYNGRDGYSIQFILVDGGEPGGGVDMMAILIKAPDDTVVLDVPLQPITRGNLQAHFDQPHGNLPPPPVIP